MTHLVTRPAAALRGVLQRREGAHLQEVRRHPSRQEAAARLGEDLGHDSPSAHRRCMLRRRCCCGLRLARGGVAQQYPSGPVTIVVPFTPGGTTDILGRLAGEVLQNEFKSSVVIENRTGAGGIIGNTSVARAAPDGQTLLLAPTAFSIVPFTSKNVPYDAGARLQADHADGLHPQRHGGVAVAAGEHGEGVHRLREIGRQEPDLCLARARHADPARRRGVRAPDRHQAPACAVPRRGAVRHRPDGRAR